MANTIQSVGRSLFNLISRVLISPIHLLAAIWFTIVTPFPAAKNPIFIKFVIPRRIRDFIYVGISPGRPPHASWVVNWLRKQAGGYIHIRYTPTALLPVLWAVTNVCHLSQQCATSAPLLHWRSCFALSAMQKLRGLFLCFTGIVKAFGYGHLTHDIAFSTSFFPSALAFSISVVIFTLPLLHGHINLFGGPKAKHLLLCPLLDRTGWKSMQQNQRYYLSYSTHSPFSSKCAFITHNATGPPAVPSDIWICYASCGLCDLQLQASYSSAPTDADSNSTTWLCAPLSGATKGFIQLISYSHTQLCSPRPVNRPWCETCSTPCWL